MITTLGKDGRVTSINCLTMINMGTSPEYICQLEIRIIEGEKAFRKMRLEKIVNDKRIEVNWHLMTVNIFMSPKMPD